MSAPAAVGVDRPTVRIRGTAYPVLLPTLRDPRLHLAGVIISLQVLGQVAFDFNLSIAQILVAVLTSAILEVAIAFRRQHVLMWPASALLTGNGVAFILRVPGTEHGDWWSMNGWWIFAGDLRRRAPLEVPDHLPRPPRLQPVELRPRSLLPPARARAGRPARLLVGADDGRARVCAGADRRGWARDPRPAAPDRDRGRLLARLRGRNRRARGKRAHDDRRLARRADRGFRVLARPRDLARDPGLPLLHDHRPADDPDEPRGAPRVRDRGRAAGDAPDRAVHDRVRGEGRRALGALHRLRRASGSRVAERDAVRLADGARLPPAGSRLRHPRAARCRRLRRPRRRCRHSGAAGGGGGDDADERTAAPDHRRGFRRSRADRPPHVAEDRARRRRRPPRRGRGPETARQEPRGRGGDGRVARGPLGADRRGAGRGDCRSRPTTSAGCA